MIGVAGKPPSSLSLFLFSHLHNLNLLSFSVLFPSLLSFYTTLTSYPSLSLSSQRYTSYLWDDDRDDRYTFSLSFFSSLLFFPSTQPQSLLFLYLFPHNDTLIPYVTMIGMIDKPFSFIFLFSLLSSSLLFLFLSTQPSTSPPLCCPGCRRPSFPRPRQTCPRMRRMRAG